MIRIKFEIEKTISASSFSDLNRELTVRKYYLNEEVNETDPTDSSYLLACRVCDFMDAIIKCMEDDEDDIDAFRSLVKDKARFVGK